MKILVLEGDGIGPEIVAATVGVVKAVDHCLNLGPELETADSGLASLEKNCSTFPDETWEKILAADGVILGPCHTAIYPTPEQGVESILPDSCAPASSCMQILVRQKLAPVHQHM